MLFDLTLCFLKNSPGIFCQMAVYINMDALTPHFKGFFCMLTIVTSKNSACLEYVNENILKDE